MSAQKRLLISASLSVLLVSVSFLIAGITVRLIAGQSLFEEMISDDTALPIIYGPYTALCVWSAVRLWRVL